MASAVRGTINVGSKAASQISKQFGRARYFFRPSSANKGGSGMKQIEGAAPGVAKPSGGASAWEKLSVGLSSASLLTIPLFFIPMGGGGGGSGAPGEVPQEAAAAVSSSSSLSFFLSCIFVLLSMVMMMVND